jgi:CMP-N-acetylneuraminic acid synthetase
MKDRVIAIIPARGGSKGLKDKNIKIIKGKPLIYWSIKAAKESKLIDSCYVSTDSKKIKKISQKYNCQVIDRPKNIAHDNSKTIDVLKHAAKKINATKIVLLQPTSPLRPKNLVDKCLKVYLKSKKKSLATGRYLHIFPWGKYNNLGRQKLKEWFWDDGLLYILDVKDINKNIWASKHKICFEVSKKFNLIEIDDQVDFEIIKKLI